MSDDTRTESIEKLLGKITDEIMGGLRDLPDHILADIESDLESETIELEEVEEIIERWNDAEPEERCLAIHLECMVDDINYVCNNTYGTGQREYLVVDDDTADELWEEQLRNYIDDCVEIPDNIRHYFDEDKWIEDAKVDGRAHCLSTYNGNEDEVEDPVTKETLFIYRIN